MTSMMTTNMFPGEPYLDAPLPSYDSERTLLMVGILLMAALFFVILPVVAAGESKQLSGVSQLLLNLSGLLAILWVLLQSSNNAWTARGAFEVPVLTDAECQYVLDMAHRVAAANVVQYPDNAMLQREFAGWRKDRHTSYPTMDLNVVTDLFTKKDREWLAHKMDTRLATAIERVYGIAPAAIRANDMFIVRYDGDRGQRLLQKHTDSGHLSFNILLNNDFEGGGTRFHNRVEPDATITIKPQKGQAILNGAVLEHEGLATTKGTRYILVGFTNIDTMDPFSGESTGLSLFSSWLSLPWLQRRFGEAHQAIRVRKKTKQKWYYNKYTKALFADISGFVCAFSDSMSPHFHLSLVAEGNRIVYLEAMDRGYQQPSKRASWFRGQQVLLNIDGTVAKEWKTRFENRENFQEL